MAFHRVIEILDQAIGGPDVGVGRHGAFWRGITRDEFVAKKVLVKATRSVYSSTGFGSSATSRSATRQERPVYKYSAEPTPAPLEASAVGELELLADNAPMDTGLHCGFRPTFPRKPARCTWTSGADSPSTSVA